MNKGIKILIIVPAFNESEIIVDVIRALHNENPDWNILVVNDASTDGTGELVQETNYATVIDLPFNLGVGGCVQTGFRYAVKYDYDIALQFDGDGQHQVTEVWKLINLIINNQADVAIGSRFLKKQNGYRTPILRRLGIRVFEVFTYFLIHQRISDHTSGFRAYNKSSLRFLAEYYPSDYPEPEAVILLGRNGFRMKEVYTEMLERQGGVSKVSLTRGPYYMFKILLSMFMTSIRSRIIKK